MCHLPPCQPQTTTQLSECATYHHASHKLQHSYQNVSLTTTPATHYNTAISMSHLPPCQPQTTTLLSACVTYHHASHTQLLTSVCVTYFSVSLTPQLHTSVCQLPHNYLLQCVTYPTTTYFSVSLTPQLLTSVCHLPHNYLPQHVSLTPQILQCVTYPTTTYFSVSLTPQLLTSVCVTYHHAITHYNTTISMCHIPPCQPHTRHRYQHVSFTTMPATYYTTTYFSCPISLACLSFSVSSSLGTTVCCLHMQKREHVKQGL